MDVVMLVNHFPPDYGGGGEQARTLAAALAHEGCRVRVVAPAPHGRSTPRREDADGIGVRRFGAPASRRARALVFGVRAAAWLAGRRFDLLHVHGFGPAALLPFLVARLRRRPVLAKTTLLGGDDPRTTARGSLGFALLRAYRRVDAIVALSSKLAEAFHEDGGFRGPIAVIPNGVDSRLFRPAAKGERDGLRRRLGLPEAAFAIVTAGEMGPRKNPDALVDAVGRMTHRPVCLLLAGPEGTDAAYSAQLDRRLGDLPEGVSGRRLGSLDRERLADLLRAADAFVLASRAEGLPNTVLEALASGLPCVVFDIPGCRDALLHGGGIVVPLDDARAFAGALDRLAADPGERARLARNGRLAVERHFSVERVARRYREVYDALLAEA